MLSSTAPLALKVAAAEMSVLMAYVRYWVCFLHLRLYKMVGFKFMKSEVVSLFFYGIYMCLISLLINGQIHKKVRPLHTH